MTEKDEFGIFGIKDDKETLECATKILAGVKKNIEKQRSELGNRGLLDESFKKELHIKAESFDKAKFLL